MLEIKKGGSNEERKEDPWEKKICVEESYKGGSQKDKPHMQLKINKKLTIVGWSTKGLKFHEDTS